MDRFEMLSAYLDGEVTAAERKQIQQWLQEDAKVQELYGRLLELRRQMQSISFTSRTEKSANQISEQVFQRLDHRKRQQKLLWGGGAIAALFIGVCSQILTGSNSFVPQIASSGGESESLMVVVNQPVVPIPKGVNLYDGSYKK